MARERYGDYTSHPDDWRIYAYTKSPERLKRWKRGDGGGVGLIKVGESKAGRNAKRIAGHNRTGAGVDPEIEELILEEEVKTPSGAWFSDKALHKVLEGAGVKRIASDNTGDEWFEATIEEVRAAIIALRTGTEVDFQRWQNFKMRPSQEKAVDATEAYFSGAKDTDTVKFLWNAKMRFGKTHAAYQLAMRMKWKRLLVITYQPAVADSWRTDLLTHAAFKGWEYVDKDTAPTTKAGLAKITAPLAWFVSFQDLFGTDGDGAVKKRNKLVHEMAWDCIVIDEYHFGAWRENAREMYDPSERKSVGALQNASFRPDQTGLSANRFLYLSGTPFRAITFGEFSTEEMFNWSYVEEQAAKQEDGASGPNPYEELPTLSVMTYELGSLTEEFADGSNNAFSLTDFFKATRNEANGGYEFENQNRVVAFLHLIKGHKRTHQLKQLSADADAAPFPFEGTDYGDAVMHSVWYLADVAACHAMGELLASKPKFSQYKIVVAAGSSVGQGAKALKPVRRAISESTEAGLEGSITLTCGKLLTGVTVREWGAILMLRNLQAPASYYQASFRVQSPRSSRLP
ncbi:DEAD/DEAH box helicase family protein, partial [Ilumatobacter sp.]|uniref:DEAD/DEAH box helicase family protein n=1 Tax=Ilumatobacter sp. TaxID=1967498 RepID=UPI003750CD6F